MKFPDVLTISVEQKHLNEGIKSCLSCPIALAIRDYFSACGEFPSVFVYSHEVSVSVGGWDHETYEVSHQALIFMEAFDEGSAVEPTVLEFKKIV